MKRCNRVLILFGFLTIATVLSAQDYAVTHRGDTLRGKIRIFNSGNERKIQVVTPDKKKQSVPIFQVRSFAFENEIFHPVKGPAGYVFMKLVREGYLSLYAFQMSNQPTFDGMFLSRKDGTSLEVPNLNFKKSMKKFLEGCPATAARIDDGTFAKKDLLAIVDHYNACVTQQSSQPEVVKKEAIAPAPETRTQTDTPDASMTSAWDQLETRVKSLDDFDGKVDAIEMIAEIRNKSGRGEKIPNFLIEGLKSALKDKGVDDELSAALSQIK